MEEGEGGTGGKWEGGKVGREGKVKGEERGREEGGRRRNVGGGGGGGVAGWRGG